MVNELTSLDNESSYNSSLVGLCRKYVHVPVKDKAYDPNLSSIISSVEETYKKAIALDPTNPVSYHNIAGTYRDTGRTELAVENFKKALKLNPSFIFSYRSLAKLYLDQKDYANARATLEAYLNHTDTKIDTLILLAQIASEQKDYSACRNYLMSALMIDPNNPSIQADLQNLENFLNPQTLSPQK